MNFGENIDLTFEDVFVVLWNQWNIYLAYNSQQIIMKCNAILRYVMKVCFTFSTWKQFSYKILNALFHLHALLGMTPNHQETTCCQDKRSSKVETYKTLVIPSSLA